MEEKFDYLNSEFSELNPKRLEKVLAWHREQFEKETNGNAECDSKL